MTFRRFFCWLFVALCLSPLGAVEVSFMGGYDPDQPESAVTRQILMLSEELPSLQPVKWGGLWLPGAGGRSPLLLAMAGGNAPDIYQCWFHIIQNDIRNGFLLPLDRWIGPNGKHWDGWSCVPELWQRVASNEGHIYGLPSASVAYYGIIYRKDLVRSAGLDPENPPQTWDEFWRWCQALTNPQASVAGASISQGQRAFGVCEAPWNWLPWMQAAGGSPVIQSRISPLRGTPFSFPMEATHCLTPEGENLSDVEPTWSANFDSANATAAAKFLQRLAWAPWIRHPKTGAPIDLTPEAIAQGAICVSLPDGTSETITFSAEEIIEGVVRKLPLNNNPESFMLGEVAAMFAGTEAMERITGEGGLDPDLIGIMPFPSISKSIPRVFQAHRHYWAISEGVSRRPKEEQDVVFQCLARLASHSLNDARIKEQVLEGNARWCHPNDLRRLGLDAYLDEIPPTIRQLYAELDAGIIVARTEPFVGFWQGVSDLIQRRLLGIILSDAGRTLNVETTLHAINEDANRGLMFQVNETELAPYRPAAHWILAGIILSFLTFLSVKTRSIIKARKRRSTKASEGSGRSGFRIALLMLLPALLSITIWSYLPLIQGVLMAFRDYHIVGESPWVGLDNFILVATDFSFWCSVGRTFKYVALTMFFGFLSPILLAVMLSEIPYGKVFFRTLYFLPHLTSILVITLLWQLMYDPTENGMLNQFLATFGFPNQTWLQDPALAMVCCVLPGVWAGAGMASLIYIAALQALPADYYEAAAIDGAGFFGRLRHVMLPQLMPLMVINFVGAFIASFQSIGSIFLLTFGGPGDATNVLSLAIWKEAYNNLRMGSATTMAWFLGTGLIGFTYLQFRILRRVEFRRAETN
ncbi:MAG: extracellular solute-binding protein [Kiritimatiellia bacterium]